MKKEEKMARIKTIVQDLINDSHTAMMSKIDRVLNSGAIDIDSWDENSAPMILPKCIAAAIIKNESHQYDGKGTSFEKRIKKEVQNIQYFL